MAKNEFDPYRESLVMEIETCWPEELAAAAGDRRQQVEQLLHAQPQQAAQVEYLRMHTGFRRKITVTPTDLERIA